MRIKPGSLTLLIEGPYSLVLAGNWIVGVPLHSITAVVLNRRKVYSMRSSEGGWPRKLSLRLTRAVSLLSGEHGSPPRR